MSRLDRYYIPPGVPARPPAPPLPRKGILMMPPPPPLPPSAVATSAVVASAANANSAQMVSQMTHRFPSSQPHQPQNWSYQPHPKMMNHHQQQLMTDAIRPRRPLPRIHNNMIMVDYEELPSQNLASAMTLPDSSPRVALQKILFLYENGDHREAANFMRRLNFTTFKSILPSLPADIFIESMPHSLPILEALYAKMFLQSKANDLMSRATSLRPEAVVWQLVKFFASQEEELQPAGQMRWEFCGPFISSCKRLLTVLLAAEPRARRVLHERKKALMKAIEGLGQHGLVGNSEGGLLYLHVALKNEFEKVRKIYEGSLEKLEQLALVHHQGKNIQDTGKKAPIAQSHQRQLSLKSSEIQERLIKNKTLLNVIEPTLENTSLEVLLGILQQRIELDKECLFQFTQVKKESHLAKNEESVAPILMRYQRGCQQVLDLMKEVAEDNEDPEDEAGNGSDISGYHSDSESAVMTSGNSPFISKEARYSFLSRSVRLGSKHNVRASILASSLCLDSASLRDAGSIKSHSCAGSVSGRSLSEGRRPLTGPPSLVIHSSSGVSSGSSDTASNEDKNGGPHSPTPSSSSSQGTVKRSPNSGANSVVSSGTKVSSVSVVQTRPPRHLKQRKEVFKPGTPSSINGSTLGSVKSCCHRCGTRSTLSTNNNNNNNDETNSTLNGSEPVYQGIVERDISVIRKETEITSLKSELAKLKTELSSSQKQVFTLEDSEKMLRERLADEKHRSLTLEKMASIQKQKALPKVNGGYSAGLDERPAHLVRRYGELYSQMRLETLDALDKLPQLVNSDELKIKLLFSVMVLAFRSVTNSISSKRDQIRRILQLPPPSLSSTISGSSGSSSSSSSVDPNKTSHDVNHLDRDQHRQSHHQDENDEENNALEPAAKDLEEAVTAYLRRATETFDLSKNVEEVCSQIWATLYDYPCLKSCDGIIKYVKECVRVAWGLVNQVPVYVIEYEARQYRPDLHVRYHASDSEADTIKTYLWPALLEGQNGPCVQKGVVIT